MENLAFPSYNVLGFFLAAKKLYRQGEDTAKFYSVSVVNFLYTVK